MSTHDYLAEQMLECGGPESLGLPDAMSDTIEIRTSRQRAADKWQTMANEDLLDLLACVRPNTWVAQTIIKELASRGVDHMGKWCGFDRSRVLWGLT